MNARNTRWETQVEWCAFAVAASTWNGIIIVGTVHSSRDSIIVNTNFDSSIHFVPKHLTTNWVGAIRALH